MKKILLVLLISVLAVAGSCEWCFAAGEGQGTAVMEPLTGTVGQTGVRFGITVTAGSEAYVAGGLYIYCPTGFSVFETNASAAGYVTAVASEGDDLTIATDGKSLSITAITVAATTGTISIYYGSSAGASGGVTLTAVAGTYDFDIKTDPDGGEAALAIASNPEIVVSAVLVIEKSVNVALDYIGQVITYCLAVTSTGIATTVNVWDTVSNGWEPADANPTPVATVVTGVDTMWRWDYVSIGNGSSELIYMWGSLTDNADPENTTNTAGTNASNAAAVDGEAISLPFATLTPTPQIEIEKSVNVALAYIGQVITFHIAATATGDANNPDIWDTLPTGFVPAGANPTPEATVVTGQYTMWLWGYASIADAASEDIDVWGSMTDNADPENITNVAQALADGAAYAGEQSIVLPFATLTPTPKIEIEKSAGGITTIQIDQEVTFRLQITGTGANTTVVVQDSLPGTWSLTAVDPTPGITVVTSEISLYIWEYADITDETVTIDIEGSMTTHDLPANVTNLVEATGDNFDRTTDSISFTLTTATPTITPTITQTITPTMTPIWGGGYYKTQNHDGKEVVTTWAGVLYGVLVLASNNDDDGNTVCVFDGDTNAEIGNTWNANAANYSNWLGNFYIPPFTESYYLVIGNYGFTDGLGINSSGGDLVLVFDMKQYTYYKLKPTMYALYKYLFPLYQKKNYFELDMYACQY